MRSRAQTIAIILSKYRKRAGSRQSFAATTPDKDSVIGKLSRVLKNTKDKLVAASAEQKYYSGNSDNLVIERAGKRSKKFDARNRPEHGLRTRSKMVKAVQAEAPIYMRPEELAHSKGAWGNDPDTWQHPKFGVVSGPIAYADLPDEMYHTTTNLPAVLASGVLRGQSDGNGMGGGNGMPGVSFSTNKLDALLTQVTIRRAILIAQLPADRTGKTVKAVLEKFARIDEEENKLPKGSLQRAVEYSQDNWNADHDSPTTTKIAGTHSWSGPERDKTPDEIDSTYRAHTNGAYKAYLQVRASAAAEALGLDYLQYQKHPSNQMLKNPLLVGDGDAFAKMKVEDVGILTVKKATLPKGALVRAGSDEFLTEIRVHADIPLTKNVPKLVRAMKKLGPLKSKRVA